MSSGNILALISPVIAIGVALLVWCLYDLSRPDRRVKGNNKLIWLAVILLGSTLGQIIYLLAGREEA